MSDLTVNAISMLKQMQQLQQIAETPSIALSGINETKKTSFSDYLSEAINGVDNDQKQTASLEKKYVHEDPSVSLSQVLLQMQKSSVSLNALVQVRNKVVEDYKNIINQNI